MLRLRAHARHLREAQRARMATSAPRGRRAAPARRPSSSPMRDRSGERQMAVDAALSPSLAASSFPRNPLIPGVLIPRAPRWHGCVSARLHSCRGATCACVHGLNVSVFARRHPAAQRDSRAVPLRTTQQRKGQSGGTLCPGFRPPVAIAGTLAPRLKQRWRRGGGKAEGREPSPRCTDGRFLLARQGFGSSRGHANSPART